MAIGASAIKAGEGFMELFLKSDRLDSALKAKSKQIGKFSLGLGGIGAGISAASAGVLTPLLMMAKGAADTGDSLKNMSSRTGISVEALSELEYVVGKTGASLGDVEKATLKMNRSLGKKDAAANLKMMGLALKDLSGMTADQKLETIFDAISKIDDPAKRALLSFKMFGGAGIKLQTAFAGGAASVTALRQELIDLGGQVTTEEANAADEFGAAWMRLKTSFEAAKYAIGSVLVPVLTDLMSTALEILKPFSEMVRNNKELAVTILKIAAVGAIVGIVLTAVGVGGLILSGIITGLGTAWGTLVAVVGVVGPMLATAFAALLSPVGLVVAGIVLLVAAFFTLTETGRKLGAAIIGTFMNMLRWVGAVIGGIFAAIVKGNWALAGQILITALAVVWTTGISTLMGLWVNLKYGVLQIMDDLGVSLQKMWVKMWANLSEGWGKMTDQLAVEMVAVRGMVDPTFDADGAIKAIRDARKEKNKGLDVDTTAIDEAAASRRKQRQDKAKDEMAPYESERKRAQAELDALIALAKKKKEPKELPFEERYKIPAKMPKLELTSGASVGTFSGFAARRLGQAAPGINEKILKEAEETNDILTQIKEMIGLGGAEFGT